MQTVSGTCPDPEALAAFVDQGSSAAEHVQVEAHLAACDDCRLLVARILETQSAVQGADAAGWRPVRSGDPRRAAAFSRKHVVWGTASLVAAAAVLAVAVNVGVDPSAYWRSLRAGSKLADLAAAVGDERTIEPRLTGGFRYGPLRAAVRSGGSSAARDHWTLYAAAGRIREVADRDPSAPNLHALGLAHLVLGQYDEAVRALEDAVSEDPDQPRYQSDLSAAYLARARQLDRPDDLPRALGAAERAVKGDERLLEARFNRALALEALFLEDQARQAWEDYLARDSSSGWANDARSHLQKLQKEAVPPPQGSDNSPPPITDTTVEAGLDWLLRHGLRAWADAVLGNDGDRAARERLAVTDYANQLSEISGDPFAKALTEFAPAEGNHHRDRAFTVRAFANALALVDAENASAAESAFSSLCAGAHGPYAALCDAQLGGFDVLHRREALAATRAESMLAIAKRHEWAYILNQAKRLRGYRLLFTGDYAAASKPYSEAYEGFNDAKYLHSAGNLAVQLADLSELVGLSRDTWHWLRQAMWRAAITNSPALVYLTRVNTAEILTRQREPEAAAVIIESFGGAGATPLSDLKQAFLEITRSRIALAINDIDRARARLQTARDAIARSQDFRASRLRADVLFIQADIDRREARLDAAQESLGAALDAMGPERVARRAGVLLLRAGVFAHQMESQTQSMRDLNEAVRLLAERTRTQQGQPLQLDEANTAFDAAAFVISAHYDLQGVPGLYLVDQLRQVLNGVPPDVRLDSQELLIAAAARQAQGATTVSFLLSADKLLAWIIKANATEFVQRHIDGLELRRLINVLSVQLDRTPEREDLWRPTLSRLHTLLLAHLPHVAESTALTIVADGVLSRVPFGSLYDSRTGNFVFERASVRMSPNLAFALRQDVNASIASSPQTAAAIGDPELRGPASQPFRRLPHARSEAIAIAKLYKNSSVVTGHDATKSRVLEAMTSADVLHYAGHAIGRISLGGSRLLLAGDAGDPQAALSAEDLRGRVKRPLRVVLAACETGSASTDRSAGLASLSGAFLRTGALSVVGTLWRVDDAASQPFFLNVHRSLVAGQPMAAAVARAQRACRSDAECRRGATTWIGATVYGSE